jgi:hypothetical protein
MKRGEEREMEIKDERLREVLGEMFGGERRSKY